MTSLSLPNSIQIFLGSLLGVITSFLFPIYPFLIAAGIAIIFDLLTGIAAAYWRKEAVRSRPIGRTIVKFIMYFSAIVISKVVETTFSPESTTLYFTYMVSGVIVFREVKSIFENVDQVTGSNITSKLDIFKKFLDSKKDSNATK